MTRLNKKAELWSYVSNVGVFRDNIAIGNSTNSVAVAPGATTVTATLITNFAAGNWLRMGAGENVEINQQVGAPVGNVITLLYPAAFAHPIGDSLIGQSQTDLGHVTDKGVTVDIKGDHNVVKSAVRRLALGYLIGHAEIEMGFELTGYALENLAAALGMLETDVTGAGTAPNPNRLVANPDLYAEQNDLSFYFRGFRKDATPVYGFLWGVELDFSSVQLQMMRGKEAPIAFRCRATSGFALSFGL